MGDGKKISKDSLAFLMNAIEHYANMEGTGGHTLPPGQEARMLEDPNWRDPVLNAPPQSNDLLGMQPKNKNESLRQAVLKSLAFLAIPENLQTLRESLLATQMYNAEQKMNKTGAPTAILYSTKW